MNAIKQAAENLSGHWHKGDYGDGRGNFCGIGHVGLALGYSAETVIDGFWEGDEIVEVLNKTAGELYPDRAYINGTVKLQHPYFAFFNDHKDTTEDEVVAVLEKAAVVFEEKKDLTD